MRAVPLPKCGHCDDVTLRLLHRGPQAWLYECPRCGRRVTDTSFDAGAVECPDGMTAAELAKSQCIPL